MNQLQNALKPCLLFTILVSAPFPIRASTVGNGGYGVRINGTIVVVDLAARGIVESPYMSDDQPSRLPDKSLEKLADLLKGLAYKESIVQLVAKKLSTLEDKARLAGFNLHATHIVDNMAEFSWLNLRDLSCLDVGDLTFPFPNQIQLAYRQDKTIRFCRDYNALSDNQMVALIIHEIIYAEYSNGQPHVSRLVGLLFDPKIVAFEESLKQEFSRELESLMVPRLIGKLEPVLSYTGHFGLTALGADMSVDGKYAITIGETPENTLKVWSLTDGRTVGSFLTEKNAALPKFTADSSRLFSIQNRNLDKKTFEVELKTWDGFISNSFRLTSKIAGGDARIFVSGDRTRIFLAESSWIGVYDSLNGEFIEDVSVGSCANQSITSIEMIPGGRSIVIGCMSKLVLIDFDSFEERVLLESPFESNPAYLYVKPWLVTSDLATVTWELCYGSYGCDSTIKQLGIIDLDSGRLRTIEADGYASTSMSVSSTGRYGIIKYGYWTERGKKFAILDLHRAEIVTAFNPPNGNDMAVDFIPGTDLILTAGGRRPQVYRITE